MAKVELLANPGELEHFPAPTTLEAEALLQEATAAAKLARDAGLPAVAERHLSRFITSHVRGIGLPLSVEDYAVWREWLPMAYRTDVRWNVQPWDAYAYDTIPLTVLELIAHLKNTGKTDFGFEALEIRTPEHRMPDPALFGHKGGRVWLLARWGESDERLLGFDEIRKGIAARHQMYRYLTDSNDATEKAMIYTVASALGGTLIGAFAATFLGYEDGQSFAFSIGGATLLVGLLIGIPMAKRWLAIRAAVAELRQKFAYAFER